MKRSLYIATGLSVIVTTLTYGYTMSHLVTHHGQRLSNPFFAMHTILAVAAGVLSLVGACFLLKDWRGNNSN